jgi:L-lactate dehydrogenase complex protein LldF
VKIDIHDQLYKWRQVIVKEGYVSTEKKISINGMATALSSPWIYRTGGRMARWLMRVLPVSVNNRFNPWFHHREMPSPPKQSFQDWYKQNRQRRG